MGAITLTSMPKGVTPTTAFGNPSVFFLYTQFTFTLTSFLPYLISSTDFEMGISPDFNVLIALRKNAHLNSRLRANNSWPTTIAKIPGCIILCLGLEEWMVCEIWIFSQNHDTDLVFLFQIYWFWDYSILHMNKHLELEVRQKLAWETNVLAEGRFERKSNGEIKWVIFSISESLEST